MAVRIFKTIDEWRDAYLAGEDVNGTSPGPVAAMLDLSRQGLHYLINSGKLDAVKINQGRRGQGIYLIPDRAIKEYLQTTRQDQLTKRLAKDNVSGREGP